MPGPSELPIQRQIRSPRSAAIAGIVFSVLLTAVMTIIRRVALASPDIFTRDWLDLHSGTAAVVLTMIPFAGIAFLWFTGVVRDQVGDREDRFFSTIFFGSGIIFVVLLFIWAAVVGAMFSVHAMAENLLADNDVFIFGLAIINEILGNYALRIAGVYMISIGTLWTKAGTMPRWLTILTYVVALGFLLFSGTVSEARFIFPVWVFLVSVYALVLNYRRPNEEPVEE